MVALSSEKVYAADAMGAEAADYVLFHRFDHHHLVASGLPKQLPPKAFFSRHSLGAALPLRSLSEWDDLSSKLALAAFHDYRPRALLINLPGSDYYGHKFGGPASPNLMRKVVEGQDRIIGALTSAYKHAGIFDKTLFVITADHGMVPNAHEIKPNQVSDAVERAGAQYLFHTGGTAKYIYLQDRFHSKREAVARQMTRVPAIVGAYFRDPSGGYQAAGPAIDKKLDAANRYLLTTFDGPTAPDVVAPIARTLLGRPSRCCTATTAG